MNRLSASSGVSVSRVKVKVSAALAAAVLNHPGRIGRHNLLAGLPTPSEEDKDTPLRCVLRLPVAVCPN